MAVILSHHDQFPQAANVETESVQLQHNIIESLLHDHDHHAYTGSIISNSKTNQDKVSEYIMHNSHENKTYIHKRQKK